MSKLSKIKFIKWTEKEIKEETDRLNEHDEEAYQAMLKWFKDAGRPLK